MYGTVARTKVKPENRDAMQEIFSSSLAEGSTPPGYIAGYLLFENDSDVAWMFAVFEDRASYDANADDPKQHEMYVAYRALMEDEPEWHDGVIGGM